MFVQFCGGAEGNVINRMPSFTAQMFCCKRASLVYPYKRK